MVHSPELVDMRSDRYLLADVAARAVAEATGVAAHDLALILGSGWAAGSERLGEPEALVALSSLPGFLPPRVPGHRDEISSVRVAERSILVISGRSHLYEGASPAEVVHGVRVAAAAGCRAVILTNAAGSLRPEWTPGQVVLISDHLNLTARSPMAGPPPPNGVPGRFCDLGDAYSERLRKVARGVAPDLPEGIYAGLLGGNYETPAEISMLRTLGADLVGMSTVLETIAARHLGLDVLGVSLVTNLAAGMSPDRLDHDEVLEAGSDSRDRIMDLIRGVLEGL